MNSESYIFVAVIVKSSVRVHGGQSSEFPIYPTTLERTITRLPEVVNSTISQEGIAKNASGAALRMNKP